MTLLAGSPSPPSLSDPALLRIVAAAERGEPCPGLCFIAGCWLVQGTPVSTHMFYTVTYQDTLQELSVSLDVRRMRVTPDEKQRILENAASEQLAALGHPDGAEGAVLNLLHASVYPPGAPAIDMGAMRVAVMSIAGWWATGFTTQQQKGGSGGGLGLGVGVGSSF